MTAGINNSAVQVPDMFCPRSCCRSEDHRSHHQAGPDGRRHRRSRCSGEQTAAAAKRFVFPHRPFTAEVFSPPVGPRCPAIAKVASAPLSLFTSIAVVRPLLWRHTVEETGPLWYHEGHIYLFHFSDHTLPGIGYAHWGCRVFVPFQMPSRSFNDKEWLKNDSGCKHSIPFWNSVVFFGSSNIYQDGFIGTQDKKKYNSSTLTSPEICYI